MFGEQLCLVSGGEKRARHVGLVRDLIAPVAGGTECGQTSGHDEVCFKLIKATPHYVSILFIVGKEKYALV